MIKINLRNQLTYIYNNNLWNVSTLQLEEQSKKFVAKQLSGYPKDKFKSYEKSGIYDISCKICDANYVGRPVLKIFKEPLADLKL